MNLTMHTPIHNINQNKMNKDIKLQMIIEDFKIKISTKGTIPFFFLIITHFLIRNMVKEGLWENMKDAPELWILS